MAALAVAGLASCEDNTDPKISAPTEFVLNTPPLASQYLQLTDGETYTFSVSQPNYGLTLAPTYGLEMSLNEDFTPVSEGTYVNADGEEVAYPAYVTLPVESQIGAMLVVKQNNMAVAMCALRGIDSAESYVDEDARPVYIRSNASVSDHPLTAITSNVIKLNAVKDYMAFSVDEYAGSLYTPGGANGWNFDNAMRIPPVGDGHFKGFMVVDGDFKFTAGPAWGNPGNYGTAEGENAVYDEASGTWSGTLVENGGNFSGLDAGLYLADVTITNNATDKGEVAGKFTLTPIKSIGLIGDFNGWGGDVDMTPDAGFTTWTASGVDLGDGGWKFRMNGGWGINLGGTLDKLTFDGDNLSNAGTHNVILDLSTLPYSARVE